MHLHGDFAYAEFSRDLLIHQSCCDEADHFQFARGQRLELSAYLLNCLVLGASYVPGASAVDVCWPTTPNFHAKLGYLGRSCRLRNVLTTTACVAICLTIIATTVGSLTQKSASALPIASIDRTPPSVIDTAMAIPRAVSIDTAAASHSRAKDSCNDFVFSFLNATCSKIRTRHVRRMTHRVATLVIGHPAASSSSATADPPSCDD